MRALAIVGALLLVVGVAALATGGFSFTTREEVLKLGPIEATAEKERSFPIPTAAAAVAILAGGVLIVAGLRRRA